MNRRKFLKYLGFGSAVAVAPSLVNAKTDLKAKVFAPKAMGAYEVQQMILEDAIVHPPLVGPTEFKGENWFAQGNKVWSEPITGIKATEQQMLWYKTINDSKYK